MGAAFGAAFSVDGGGALAGAAAVVAGPVVAVGFAFGAVEDGTLDGAAVLEGDALVVVVASSGLPRPPCAAVAIPPAATNNAAMPATMISARRLPTV